MRALAAALALFTSYAHAQTPDWPCQQRLVPHLEAGAYWPIQATADPNWRENPPLFTAVTNATSRDTPDAEAIATLTTYAATIPPPDRARTYPALFAALVDQTNDDRDQLITRIEKFGHRQRDLDNTIAAETTTLDALPPNAPDRPDLTGQRDFNIRIFKQTQATMRYACEAPGNMERRLGTLAQSLRSYLLIRD